MHQVVICLFANVIPPISAVFFHVLPLLVASHLENVPICRVVDLLDVKAIVLGPLVVVIKLVGLLFPKRVPKGLWLAS